MTPRILTIPPLLAAALLQLPAAACARGPARPAPLDTRNDTCGFCRMVVSDRRFAAQIAVPGEEPRFFDDIGCLRTFLAGSGNLPGEARVYVADHRTGDWAPASRAVFMSVPGLQTPMDSHWIAHTDTESRDTDPVARDGVPLPASAIFGPPGPPGA